MYPSGFSMYLLCIRSKFLCLDTDCIVPLRHLKYCLGGCIFCNSKLLLIVPATSIADLYNYISFIWKPLCRCYLHLQCTLFHVCQYGILLRTIGRHIVAGTRPKRQAGRQQRRCESFLHKLCSFPLLYLIPVISID